MRALCLPVIAICFASTACTDNATEPEQLPDCAGEVSVAASSGTTPTFSYTPRCRIMFLLVEPAATGSDLWSVETSGRNRIGPDVRYGVVPAGAVQLDARLL